MRLTGLSLRLLVRLDADERAAYLLKVADILENRLEEFACYEAMDTGKPISETRTIDIPLAVRAFRFHADSVKSLTGKGHHGAGPSAVLLYFL